MSRFQVVAAFIAVFAVAGLSLPAVSAAPAGVAWRQDLRQATSDVGRSGRPLLLFFGSPSCGPCHRMLRETFANAEVAGAVNQRFVPVLINADADPALTSQLGVDAYPTIVIADKSKIVGRVTGFQTSAELTRALAAWGPPPAVRAVVRERTGEQPFLRSRPPISAAPVFHNPFVRSDIFVPENPAVPNDSDSR
jgi:thioredoxin-related protein